MRRWMFGSVLVGSVVLALSHVTATASTPQKLSGETRTESFAVTKGGYLSINSNLGDVIIATWAKSEVSVSVEGISSDNMDDLRMSSNGTTVRVDFYPTGSKRSKYVRFKMDIPVDFNLDLRTGSGEIEIIGGLNGAVRVHTANGDITMDDIDGKVDVSTSAGDIRTGKLNGVAYLKTSGGDVRVEGATAELDVRTSGGNIKIGNVGKWLDANTSGGNIIVGDVGGEARLSTAGGDIEVGRVRGGARINTAGGMVRLSSASGDVTANTAGGDVELYDISGSIDARTAGGDIFAEIMPKGAGRSSLVTAGGDVRLNIDPRARATIEARVRMDRESMKRYGAKYKSKGKSLSSDYDIRSPFKAERYEEDFERGEIRATYILNGGGERIWLETSYGSIEIRELLIKK